MLAVRDRLQLHPPRVERGRDALQLNRSPIFCGAFHAVRPLPSGQKKKPANLAARGLSGRGNA
jgi:hypothetical protein